MSEAIKMYGLPAIIRHDIPIELPSCMYRLGNIHTCGNEEKLAQNEVERTGKIKSQADVDITKKVKQFLKDNSTPKEMMDVILKQERILEQLEGLQRQMQTIREQLKISKTTTKLASTTTKRADALNLKNVPEDLVIIASPSNPPFSLLLLQRLWLNAVNLSVQTFKHSTVVSLDEPVQNFSQNIEGFASKNNLPKVNVRLIWKEVGANKLELNLGANQLIGECNVLRFLARLTNGLNYDESNYEIDSFIDLSHRIVTAANKTKRAKLLQFLTKKLGKSEFLFGDNISIADIAIYSAIKQTTANNEITGRLNNWIQKCEAV